MNKFKHPLFGYFIETGQIVIRGCLLPLVTLGQSTVVFHMKCTPQYPKFLETLNLGSWLWTLGSLSHLLPNSANDSKAPHLSMNFIKMNVQE